MAGLTLKSELPRTIHKNILTVPGASPTSRAAVERLLEEDREKFHCHFGPVPFHNHTSHHLLATYDLGATAARLQAIYDADAQDTLSIFKVSSDAREVEPQDVTITRENWTGYLGLKNEKYYANFIRFFEAEVKRLGAHRAFEHYIFSSDANDNGAQMLERFVGGLYHPLIQMGYAIEFNSDAMVPQALAQTAVHDAWFPELMPWNAPNDNLDAPSAARPLFDVIREAYSSGSLDAAPFLKDYMFFNALKPLRSPERAAALRRLVVQWVPTVLSNKAISIGELQEKLRDLSFLAVLCFAGTGRAGRPLRLDFFLMHVLTSQHFLPYLLDVLEEPSNKSRLLAGYLSVLFTVVIGVGSPKLDASLLMSFTDTPRKAGEPADANVWAGILPPSIRSGDLHVAKAVRALLAASLRYGALQKGSIPGAPDVDGSAFVRAAGAMMENMDWIPKEGGERDQGWDRAGLGWDEVWKE